MSNVFDIFLFLFLCQVRQRFLEAATGILWEPRSMYVLGGMDSRKMWCQWWIDCLLKCVRQIEISIRLSPSRDCEAHNFLYFLPQVYRVLLYIRLLSNWNQFSLWRRVNAQTLSVLAGHEPFYISICITTQLAKQDTTSIKPCIELADML